MSQKQKILNLLSDGRWHCLTNEMYMKDDRARISELKKSGHKFSNDNDMWCNNPEHRHYSKVKLRRLESPSHPVLQVTALPGITAAEFLRKYPSKTETVKNQLF